MKTSAIGLSLIMRFESFRSIKYQDGGGVWTIGWGHTGIGVSESPITRDRAKELLKEDVRHAEHAVSTLVEVKLSQDQFDALVSLVFNIGYLQFATSTLRKKLNLGDYYGALNEFPRWIYDNGKIVKGLCIRRFKEGLLFAGVGADLAPTCKIDA